MASRRNPTSVKTPENLTPFLEFLAAPLECYEQRENKPPQIQELFYGIQDEHSSVIKGNIDGYVARQELKDIFDRISEIAKTLLEKKDSIGIKWLNTTITTIDRALKDIEKLKAESLTDGTKDSPETGMWQKFFEGANTLDAVFINITTILETQLKIIANKHSPKLS